jgi:hypothetical protein
VDGEWYKNTRVVGSAACYQSAVKVVLTLGVWPAADTRVVSTPPLLPSSQVPKFPLSIRVLLVFWGGEPFLLH